MERTEKIERLRKQLEALGISPGDVEVMLLKALHKLPIVEGSKMNLIWQHDGVAISGITTNRFVNSQMYTTGSGWTAGKQFQWEATVTPLGWYITIHAAQGKIGEVQGNTFNLPLEVAAAVRRLLHV